MPKFKLHRRTVLRGLLGGSVVSVALPTLQAMLNDNGTAYAGGAQLPVRFMTYFWADGVNLGRFEPAAVGPDWVPSEELAPLTPLKEYVTVLTGLQNRSTVAITHHEGMTIFNGYDFIQGGGLNTDAGGPTIDQLIADVLARETPVRGVHVQVSKRVSTDGDGGTTAIAMSHRGTPGNLIVQTPQINPQLVWQTLFGNFVEQVDTRPPRLRVLDAVREDANRLMGKLGAEDKQRFEAHLLAVDELETKIAATPPVCFLPDSPSETNSDVGGQEPISAVTKAMADLIAYAFACDITRVASFMFKRFVSGTVFDEINANEVHHSASHSPGSETYHQGVTYQMQKLFDVLDTLKNTADIGGGNLLDSTIVFASSDCSTGFSHSISRQPIILAGHGRGYLVHPGIHYQTTPWNQDEGGPNGAGNAADALLTCLKCFDPSATTIGGGACQTSNVISDIIA